MTSKRRTTNDRIDKMAGTAKRAGAPPSGGTERAPAPAGQAHEVGQQPKDAGEKPMKKADRR